MRRLRPLKILLFRLIGRLRCEACGDHPAPAVRTIGRVVWRVCPGCAAWIDAGFPQEPLEATR